jgi:hypothetical protein
MALVMPFPLYRRADFVARQARTILGMNAASGERYLQRQLLVQREALARKGVHSESIEGEVRRLEAAIRAALWRSVLTPAGR